jgi:hypothetical protein
VGVCINGESMQHDYPKLSQPPISSHQNIQSLVQEAPPVVGKEILPDEGSSTERQEPFSHPHGR